MCGRADDPSQYNDGYGYLGDGVSGRTGDPDAAPAPSEPGLRCNDDFYCGECPDCLSGEHPENRLRGQE